MKHSVKYSISFFASRRFSEGQNGDVTDLCAIIEKVSTPFTNTVSIRRVNTGQQLIMWLWVFVYINRSSPVYSSLPFSALPKPLNDKHLAAMTPVANSKCSVTETEEQTGSSQQPNYKRYQLLLLPKSHSERSHIIIIINIITIPFDRSNQAGIKLVSELWE